MSAVGPSSDNKNGESQDTGNSYMIDCRQFLTLYKMMTPAQQVATMNRLTRKQQIDVFHEAQKTRPK